jgi:hypothetical protein
LSKLPEEVELACPDAIEFTPEISASQAAVCKELQSELMKAREKIDKVEDYHESLEDFIKNFDLWVGESVPDFQELVRGAEETGENSGMVLVFS